jgi:hypothetical protein
VVQLSFAQLFIAVFALLFAVVLMQWLRTGHRAADLLRAHLTPDQLQSYSMQDFFIVEGQSGQRYRLNRKDGIPWIEGTNRYLCVHCPRHIPLADALLTYKLMLECNEQAFLERANSRVRFEGML